VREGETPEEDMYRVDCFNPFCEAQNWMMRGTFFALKNEISLIANRPKVNVKTPGDMKILLISMERSGSSWVGAHMSIEHMKIYGKMPLWNHECDRRYAVFKKVKTKDGIVTIETPKGWTSVYEVNPKEALEKDFDKVILLQKDLEALKEDICKYNHPKAWALEQELKKNPKLLDEEESLKKYCETYRKDRDGNIEYIDKKKGLEELDFFVRLRRAIERDWHNMFSQEIEDPKLYKFALEDLNNFTEWEWDKLLDFLEFPERSRCHSFAVNRNWQVFSDVLPTGIAICPRLRQLQEIHPNVLAKEIINEDLFFFKMRDKGKFTDSKTYPFVNKVNPYIRMPYEKIPLEPRSFRITADGDIKDVLKEDKTRVE
jgi:hypothetical protein